MFVNTCGGDQNPLPRRKVELCEKYGHMLADGVEEVLKQPLKPVSPGLRTAFEYVDLPYLKVVTREELQGLLEGRQRHREPAGPRGCSRKLDAGEKFEPAYPYPVHAWRLGKEMLVIGMGAETVVDYALRFKGEFGPGTWVCGYADDMIAYIPSRRVWEEGGYEGGLEPLRVRPPGVPLGRRHRRPHRRVRAEAGEAGEGVSVGHVSERARLPCHPRQWSSLRDSPPLIGRSPTLKGSNSKAQGCRVSGYPGLKKTDRQPTLKGLHTSASHVSCNPFRVDDGCGRSGPRVAAHAATLGYGVQRFQRW